MPAILRKLWSLRLFHPDNGARLLRFLSSNRPLVWPINLVLNGAWQLRKRLRAKTTVTPNRRGAALLQAPCHVPAATLFARHVLIIAELSIRQCKKYRVDQKVAELESLGYRVTVCSWSENAACRTALQTAGEVIFYRVPGFPPVMELLAEARRLQLRIGFDVDDIVFCETALQANDSLHSLSEAERQGVLEGARLYRQAMLACDYGIASTPTIASSMLEAGLPQAYLLENALDPALLALQPNAPAAPETDGVVTIGYGSGTKTHDADFACAAPALREILRRYPQVRLVIYGLLDLKDRFAGFEAQIWRVDFLNAEDYYRALAQFSINIAPLTPALFNDAKSNIKWTEASLFAVPSVCSPAAAFTQVIEHGRTGFLAETEAQWVEALAQLVESAALRRTIGQAAQAAALAHYHYEAIARTQWPLILPPAAPRARFRVLMANILFSPQSFGGATIVVEQLAQWFAAQPDTEVMIFTASWDEDESPLSMVRYNVGAVNVVKVRLPQPESAEAARQHNYHSPEMAAVFDQLLVDWSPDVVHLHAIQQIGGAALIERSRARGVPCAVTLHDAWWLCARQFMMTPADQFCQQRTIRLPVCSQCTGQGAEVHQRAYTLRQALNQADLLLTPSVYQQQLYLDNGPWTPPVRVNKNGVLPPATRRPRADSVRVRFAYVGGRAAHKGYFSLKPIFEGLHFANWQLKLVNIEANFGQNPFAQDQWAAKGEIVVVPPFDADSMDDFFAGVDVLLFPSQVKESFGLVVREALLRDVWVIATDSGGVGEEIISGVNGDLVPFNDEAALQRAIAAVLADPQRFVRHQNPHRDQIRTVSQQAEELYGYLQALRVPASEVASC